MEQKLTIKLNNGMEMPRLGMGTWFLGENKKTEGQEIEAFRVGIDAGISLIDTAEMYGSGKSEQLIGKAIEGYAREKLFLVSKVYPHNAGRMHIFKSVQKTLKNLKTDYLDLYLPIPRSGKAKHVLQNQKVWEVVLSDEEYAPLDAAYPAPSHKTYLDIV